MKLTDDEIYSTIGLNYSLELASLVRLKFSPEEGRALFRVLDATGQHWTLRLQHLERPAPVWVQEDGAADWLNQRANLLVWLETQSIAAPNILQTNSQSPISAHGEWIGILTSYLAGDRLAISGPDISALADTLSRLHVASIQHAGKASPLTINSWWHPLQDSAKFALQQLDSYFSEISKEWHDLYSRSHAILREAERPLHLPMACIHGDSWIGNAIRSPEGEIHLVDWDTGGLGAAVLDVATLLEDCYTVTDGVPLPQPEWIASLLSAYQKLRNLTPDEWSFLPEAIQFGTAFRTAIRFSIGVRENWPEAIVRGLTHEQTRLEASTHIAAIAAASRIPSSLEGYNP